MPLSGASETLVRRWLDRPENRAEWERLRDALSLAEGFQFFALQVSDPIAELFLEMLLKGEAGDSGVELVGFDLSRPPEEGPIVRVLLRELESSPRPSWFFFRGSSMFRERPPALGDFFLYLNQKRDIVAQTAGAPFLFSLPLEGWSLFRQTAPDFWSIHTSVFRFGGAEIRREERVREASEEAFVWQTFTEFVALRFLRAALPTPVRRNQPGGLPPPARNGLIGRESEKRTLRTWLAQPGARVLVSGIEGIGKTSLLLDVMADMPRSYPDGIFYFSLGKGAEAKRIMEDVVSALRPGVLVPLLRNNVLQTMFRDVTAENKILLVLDDAEDLEALDQLIPNSPSAALAAGRSADPRTGWRRLQLDLLGPRESTQMLQRIFPGFLGEGSAGGHPLLLQVLGGLAGADPEGLRRLTATAEAGKPAWNEPRFGLGIIDAAISVLTPDCQETYGAAAVFQGSFDLKRLRMVADLSSNEVAKDRLENLVSRRLLEHPEKSYWSMHPLLRDAALRSLGPEVAEILRRKHATYHLLLLAGAKENWEDFLPDVEEALRWLDASRKGSPPDSLGDLMERIGVERPQEYLRLLPARLANVWLDTVAQATTERENKALAIEVVSWSALASVQAGDMTGARERFIVARELARGSGQPYLQAAALRHWAAFALWTGRADETSGLAQDVLRLSPEDRARGDLSILAILAMVSLGEDLEELQVKALSSLTEGAGSSISPALRLLVGHTLLGRFAEERDLKGIQSDLETALEAEANPARDLGVQAWVLALRAELQLRQGSGSAAQESAESALHQAHDAYDWEAEAEVLRVMGQVQEDTGQLEMAASSYRRLLELREQLYSADHEGVAWASRDLGRLMEAMARTQEAEHFYLQAVAIFQRGRPATDRALAAALYGLGRLLLRIARYSEAETFLREALAASLSSLGPAHLNSVRILGILAYLAEVTGRLEEAEDLLRSALAIQEHSEASKTPTGRNLMGQNLSLLAHVLAARGHLADALAVLQDRQLPIFDELGDPQGRAATLGQIAELLASENRYDESLSILREELTLFNELGDVRGRASVLGDIASLFDAQKRYDEAIPLLREQLSLLERLGDRQEIEDVRKALQAYERKQP